MRGGGGEGVGEGEGEGDGDGWVLVFPSSHHPSTLGRRSMRIGDVDVRCA
jgi:hypothetical protein